MGVDYVSLMLCVEAMVADYEAATKTKLQDQAAKKMKTHSLISWWIKSSDSKSSGSSK